MPKSIAALQREVEEWNAQYSEGTTVTLVNDRGNKIETKTRSEAWVMGGHSAMIMVDGIAGGYLLERVKPV